ncbi:MAG: ribonuclease BN-like protein, partial [Deltaproteobacteria bacterium]|nr:ribonuclease BN-like protein [Deltaproteobacteria bacterium]
MIKNLFNRWKDYLKTFFTETLWEIDETMVRGYRRFFLYVVRVATITFKGYHDNMIPVRATALAYTTLISIVPFLAVTFSLFKAFGGLNKAMDPI